MAVSSNKEAIRSGRSAGFVLLLSLWAVAGCATSGDVEQARQEQAQAKAKMSAELQQERDLAASMEKDSEAKRASAEKLAQALQGKGNGTTLALSDDITKRPIGTTLKITNKTSDPVPVQITLGNSGNPASNYGISNIGQLPQSWNITPYPPGSTTQGIFSLGGGSSVAFNSGTNSFSGNVAFGPTFDSRGCGNNTAGACYPNSVNLAEFTLNIAGGTETVDISDVNGVNANITINFTGQKTGNQWNDGSFSGANTDVTSIANLPITSWTSPPGVFGWQATNCINVTGTPPNPLPNCPAPVNTPSAAQLQTNVQCNIQRTQDAPTGGTVQIAFNGYTANSAPQAGCVAIYTINPASGSQNGSTTVSMTGWGLSQVTSVTFQGATATIVSRSNTSLVVTTPPCNFCTPQTPQPWNSNVMLNLPNGVTYTLPIDIAGPTASAAYVFTSN